jgi:hypothetical protein
MLSTNAKVALNAAADASFYPLSRGTLAPAVTRLPRIVL